MKPAKTSGAFQLEGRHSFDHENDKSFGQLDLSSFVNLENTILNTHYIGIANQSEYDKKQSISWNVNRLRLARVEQNMGLEFSAGDCDLVSSEFLYTPKIWGVRMGSIREPNRFNRIHFGSMSIVLDQLSTVAIL